MPCFGICDITVMDPPVWIDDPENGISNVRDAVLKAVWDSFYANGVEIALRQRDLHIKSAVPLEISRGNARPVAKNAPTNEEQKNHRGKDGA